MADRKMHHWKVSLINPNGTGTKETTFASFWDPAKTDSDVIGRAAAIQAGGGFVHTEVKNID